MNSPDWRSYGGRTPRFNFDFLSFLLEEDAKKRSVHNFNPDRYHRENTSLLKKYWCKPDVKAIAGFQLLYLLGGDPTELPSPEMLLRQFHKPLTNNEINDFQTFLDEAQKAWREEHRMEAVWREYEKKLKEQQDQSVVRRPESVLATQRLKTNGKEIIALSIAGGGSRCMIGALILRFVSNRVFGDEGIVRRVHWIAGASMGSVITLNLVKQDNMKPSDCLNLFWSLLERNAFELPSILEQTNKLEQVFRENFGAITMGMRLARSDGNDYVPKVCLTSTMVSRAPAQLFLHRNYRQGSQTDSQLLLTDVARASSADAKHFSHFTVGRQSFFCTGPPCSTPVHILASEIEAHSSLTKIAALLSIETGKDGSWYSNAKHVSRISNSNRTQHWASAIDEYSNRAVETVLNRQGEDPRFMRLKPRLPIIPSKTVSGWEYKQVTRMWHTLRYLTEPSTLEIIDRFQRAYEDSQA